MDRRSPIVTIELQVWPQPPDEPHLEPYWFGASTLAFRKRFAPWEHVWEQQFIDLPGIKKVVYKPNFGWVIVIELMHDPARRLLGRAGVPADIERPLCSPMWGASA